MLNALTKIALVAATVVSALPANAWEKETRQKYRNFYQNVTAVDLPKLIGGKVWVDYMDNTDRFRVTFFGHDGVSVICGTKNADIGRPLWKSVIFDNKKQRERYPLWQETLADGKVGYLALKYIAETGDLFSYVVQKPYWWEMGTGHLQSDIPAAVYTACPDFPSAKSLGLKVNSKQTSIKYHEMIKQDPGNRVKRPDLVTAETVETY